MDLNESYNADVPRLNEESLMKNQQIDAIHDVKRIFILEVVRT